MTQPTAAPTAPRRRRTPLVVGVLALVALLVGGGLWWFLRDDAPEEVSLTDAVDDAGESAAEGEGDPAAGGGDISGTWVVDTESGEFSFDDASGSFAGFRVQEELASIGATTAVGRTPDVDGTVEIDGTTVTAADIEVDLTTITTDDSRRDGKVQDALETSRFPTATFSLTEPIELGEGAADGTPVSVTASGELTIHGVTRPVQLPLEAQLEGGTVVVVGSTTFPLSDFEVEAPSAPIVLSVSDEATLELQLLLARG